MVDEQVLIVNELRGSVLKCARDQNANHVLQRILERVPADRVRFIAEACEGQVHSLATHPYGMFSVIYEMFVIRSTDHSSMPRLPSPAAHLGEHKRCPTPHR